ncbi:hypothetical protein BFG57_17015 [Bacillus solimangrovi]|uniref:OmpR/PhoB-type domain-containing protein n=2 Tax=Bacillus solimangrovi TaxID=1305675 RepID=A0A1E5LDB8_9BACI|nr:hypothetical protein BFG57_17015 [Bacillus solimangrovi]
MAQLNFHEKDYTVTYGVQTIELLRKEFELLRFLYEHTDQTFSREKLLDNIWKLETPIDRTVDDHIYRLRKKLQPLQHIIKINTVRGLGYTLQVKSDDLALNPSLIDSDLNERANEILEKYHLYGQGEALHTLIDNQTHLGLQINPFYNLYLKFIQGQFFEILDNHPNDLEEKIFFFLGIYSSIQDDVDKTLLLYERALRGNVFSPEREKEVEILSIIPVLIQAGHLTEASKRLAISKQRIFDEKLDGFHLYFKLTEVFYLFQTNGLDEASHKLEEVDKMLKEQPFLREKGHYLILKGIDQLRKGLPLEAEQTIDTGLAIIKQSRFEFINVHLLHMLLQFLRERFHESRLLKKYEKEWNRLAKKYDFDTLRRRIENEILIHIPSV